MCYIGSTQTIIHLVTTETPFNGRRRWFLCPGCLERRAVLRLCGQTLRCRQCLRGVYSSQYQPKGITICRLRAILRARLRRIDRMYPVLPPDAPLMTRPKGMWNRTWRKIVHRDRSLNLAYNAAVRGTIGAAAADVLDLWDEDDYGR